MPVDAWSTAIAAYSPMPPLPRSKQAEVILRAQRGDRRAQQRILRGNILLVASVARRYHCDSLEPSDLLAVGARGMLTATERFDVTTGLKFITYAIWWVRQAILHEIDQRTSIIRVPNNHVLEARRAAKKRSLGQELTKSEEDALQVVDRCATLASLDAPDLDGEQWEIADPNQDAQARTLESARARAVSRILLGLQSVERDVLMAYYGLGGHSANLREIADRVGISHERVRQIKEQALERLRGRSAAPLRDFIDWRLPTPTK